MPLFEQMVEIAKPVVKHWFEDVTVHDRKAVEEMQIGEARVWFLRTTGTWLCCLAQDKDSHTDFQGLITSVMRSPELYMDGDGYKNIFLIHKTGDNEGEINPIGLDDLNFINKNMVV